MPRHLYKKKRPCISIPIRDREKFLFFVNQKFNGGGENREIQETERKRIR